MQPNHRPRARQARPPHRPAQPAPLVDGYPGPSVRTTHHPRATWRLRSPGARMSSTVTAGFFTLGVRPDLYHLPHPCLGLPVILLIRRVLLRAFELLREQSLDLAAATEDEVTATLRSTIENNLRQTGEVKGFNKRTFEFVVRQGQCQNFNGTVLAKTPDLFFKLRDDDSQRARVLS